MRLLFPSILLVGLVTCAATSITACNLLKKSASDAGEAGAAPDVEEPPPPAPVEAAVEPIDAGHKVVTKDAGKPADAATAAVDAAADASAAATDAAADAAKGDAATIAFDGSVKGSTILRQLQRAPKK